MLCLQALKEHRNNKFRSFLLPTLLIRARLLTLLPDSRIVGVLIDNGDGTFDYDPDPNFNGTDSFTYQVSDSGFLLSNTATVNLTVSAVNDAPVAVDDAGVGFTTTEDMLFTTATVTTNDTDVDDAVDPASITIVSGPTDGTLTDNGNGTFDYNPNPNFNGTDTFTYTITDPGPLTSNTATVTITITADNDAPVANNDGVIGFTTLEDTPFTTLDVTANDTDVEDITIDPATITVLTLPTDGTLIDNGNGTFDYDPNADFNGTDTFTYTITDPGPLTSNTATVTLTITAVPDDPQAVDDGYSTPVNTTLNVPASGVLTNDADPDGDPITVDTAPSTPPTSGSVTLAADGSFMYVPDLGFSGTDRFAYSIDDGTGRSGTATVIITVSDTASRLSFYLGDSGPAAKLWDLVGSPLPPADPEPDHESDGKEGLTIGSSNGSLGVTNPSKYHHWSSVQGSALALDGPVNFELWSTLSNFSPTGSGRVYTYLQDCMPDETGCVLILSTVIDLADWNEGVADWVFHDLNLGSATYTVPAGRMLRLRVQIAENSQWLAMSGGRPSQLVVSVG